MRSTILSAAICGALLTGLTYSAPRALRPQAQKAAMPVTEGALLVRLPDGNPGGECPLTHTDVQASITGFMARVEVTQNFENKSATPIEAVYVFPLPHNAAVDDMTIIAGDRHIKGLIKKRDEARAIFDAARANGQTAGLLDQERPNIFTQSLTNIPAGTKVQVKIRYVETLPYEAGTYSFVFPMVVGPRYIPGNPVGQSAGGWSPDTDRVPDASKITPQVAAKGTRAGHDISISVDLDAGLPLDAVSSPSHDVDVRRRGQGAAAIKLRAENTIPNRDFVLKYDVAGRTIADAVLTHRGEKGGFFTLVLQPPEQVRVQEVTPKELVFVLDTSGSMMGFPIEKAKESMQYALAGLNPRDTFNLITFAGDTQILFPQPVPATPENMRLAQQFLSSRRGAGGTEMMKAIRAALDSSDKQDHVRVVCFMTDGYVGNEAEIIAEVKQHPNARVFSFGIGQSVNRYLLDKMAEAGRGEVEYVSLNDDGSAAAKRFHERVRNPLLTDIKISWNGLPISELYPARVPDLFSAKPLVITGRYDKPASGSIRIESNAGGRPYRRDVAVNLPAAQPEHAVLATLWARTKVDYLMHEQTPAVAEITRLGLDYKLMTPYTSFVAVDERVVNEGGRVRRIEVPVEMPAGVSHEGVFGEDRAEVKVMAMQTFVAGSGAATGGGVYNIEAARKAAPMPATAPPPPLVKQEMADAREVDGIQKIHASLRNLKGKVEVNVWVLDQSPATLAALRQAGLEFTSVPGTPRLVKGHIDATKLEQLAKLRMVTFIAPVR